MKGSWKKCRIRCNGVCGHLQNLWPVAAVHMGFEYIYLKTQSIKTPLVRIALLHLSNVNILNEPKRKQLWKKSLG